MNLIKNKISLILAFFLLTTLVASHYQAKNLKEINTLLELKNNDLTYKNTNLENLVLKLEENYHLSFKKLDELNREKLALNKEISSLKLNFKEQENEEINDNLLDAVGFINKRLCTKN